MVFSLDDYREECVKGVDSELLLKMVGQTLFRSIVLGVGTLQWGREMKLHLKYSMGKWGFIVREQGGGWWMENY